MMQEADILGAIEQDAWMMAAIAAAARLDLPQWMIGGGFLRNKVWDHLHGITRAKVDTPDIDLIYFDAADVREETEKAHDARLRHWCDENWSCKNQARMHTKGGFAPFTSAVDGLAHWRTTANSVAVMMRDGRLALEAPYGIGDLVALILRPTPYYADKPEELAEMAERKQWLTKWPRLSFAAGVASG